MEDLCGPLPHPYSPPEDGVVEWAVGAWQLLVPLMGWSMENLASICPPSLNQREAASLGCVCSVDPSLPSEVGSTGWPGDQEGLVCTLNLPAHRSWVTCSNSLLSISQKNKKWYFDLYLSMSTSQLLPNQVTRKYRKDDIYWSPPIPTPSSSKKKKVVLKCKNVI